MILIKMGTTLINIVQEISLHMIKKKLLFLMYLIIEIKLLKKKAVGVYIFQADKRLAM